MTEIIDPIRCMREEKLDDDGFDIQEHINILLERKNKERWERTKNIYHPSSIRGCKRALYYDRVGLEPKQRIPADLRLLFDMGHSIHDMLQSLIAQGGEEFSSEDRAVFEPLHLGGSCDGVFRARDWILEIKTVGESVFRSLVKPKEDHLWQIHCYMWAFDIPRCQLLYVNRASGRMRNFKVSFSNEVWEKVTDVIQLVEGYVEQENPPPKEPNRYMCGTCKFFYECKPDFN